VDATSTSTVQEVHLVVLHLLCEAVDVALASSTVSPFMPLAGGAS
jgi:hypothetical protein